MFIAIVLGAQIDLFFTYTRYHLAKIASPRPSPPPTSHLTRTLQQVRRYVGSLTQMGGQPSEFDSARQRNPSTNSRRIGASAFFASGANLQSLSSKSYLGLLLSSILERQVSTCVLAAMRFFIERTVAFGLHWRGVHIQCPY